MSASVCTNNIKNTDNIKNANKITTINTNANDNTDANITANTFDILASRYSKLDPPAFAVFPMVNDIMNAYIYNEFFLNGEENYSTDISDMNLRKGIKMSIMSLIFNAHTHVCVYFASREMYNHAITYADNNIKFLQARDVAKMYLLPTSNNYSSATTNTAYSRRIIATRENGEHTHTIKFTVKNRFNEDVFNKISILKFICNRGENTQSILDIDILLTQQSQLLTCVINDVIKGNNQISDRNNENSNTSNITSARKNKFIKINRKK